jgi:hypothetical protein
MKARIEMEIEHEEFTSLKDFETCITNVLCDYMDSGEIIKIEEIK